MTTMLTDLQTIIDTGDVPDDVATGTLESALILIEWFIAEVQESRWGAMGQAALVHHRQTYERIQTLLNRRHGLDGMTPV